MAGQTRTGLCRFPKALFRTASVTGIRPNSYAAYSPSFHLDGVTNSYVGGQFWDGRANSLEEQAMGPFLNALEMNNPDKAAVVNDVKNSMYASMFRSVYGANAFDNVDTAYSLISKAIASYERTSLVNSFDSKFDKYKAGSTTLTAQESRGLKLFEGKAGCSSCHPSKPGPYATKALFTDFGYDNVGVPKNPNNPFYSLSPEFNPAGAAYIDYGLGGRLGDAAQNGSSKHPACEHRSTAPYIITACSRTCAMWPFHEQSRCILMAGAGSQTEHRRTKTVT